jgi:hypothetical protein
MYAQGRVYEASPVAGASEGLQKLKDMGYTLVIVTAREKNEILPTEKWLEKYFPGEWIMEPKMHMSKTAMKTCSTTLYAPGAHSRSLVKMGIKLPLRCQKSRSDIYIWTTLFKC